MRQFTLFLLLIQASLTHAQPDRGCGAIQWFSVSDGTTNSSLCSGEVIGLVQGCQDTVHITVSDTTSVSMQWSYIDKYFLFYFTEGKWTMDGIPIPSNQYTFSFFENGVYCTTPTTVSTKLTTSDPGVYRLDSVYLDGIAYPTNLPYVKITMMDIQTTAPSEPKELFKISPNPATDLLKLDFPGNLNVKVEIYAMDGSIVDRLSITNQSEVLYNVSGYVPGLYTFLITTMKGHIEHFKVIVP